MRNLSDTPDLHSVTVNVPGKVGLYIEVGKLGANGYHSLSAVFQAVSLIDEVVLISTGDPHIDISVDGSTANGGSVPLDESNLAWRAASAVAKHAGRPPQVRILLNKSIPVAGGMAGGSADAAGALLGMSALWRLNLSDERLTTMAVELGSDVPFALQGGTALATGRGERLVPVSGQRTLHWVFAIHKQGLSTPAVYAELDRIRSRTILGLEPSTVSGIKLIREAFSYGTPREVAGYMRNDLEAAAVSLEPSLKRTLQAGVGAGALRGMVSGSGSTCAFLCGSHSEALSVATALANAKVCHDVRVAHGPVVGARVVRTVSV